MIGATVELRGTATGNGREAHDDGREAIGKARAAVADERVDPWLAYRFGRLAGILFIAASIGSIPNYFLEEPRPEGLYWLVVLAALASGVICLAVSWGRLPRRTVHLVCAAAALEILAVTLTADAELEVL